MIINTPTPKQLKVNGVKLVRGFEGVVRIWAINVSETEMHRNPNETLWGLVDELIGMNPNLELMFSPKRYFNDEECLEFALIFKKKPFLQRLWIWIFGSGR